MADLDRIILPGITHWQHPSFFAFFPSNLSYSSILAELTSAGLGIVGMNWATSPAATELETHVMDWMRELLGLPEAWTGKGVIQDSASSCTLVSALAARHRHRDTPVDQMVGYCTSQAHSSVEKALRIAGVPMHVVGHDGRFAMRPELLRAAIAEDLAAGRVPVWVCGTRGTTSSLAFDPLVDIGEICAETGVWFHVDAAMAGIGALCPEYRWINAGVTAADSYCTNAHKWMGVNFDCSLFWVRDTAPLFDALSILPEYLRSGATGQVIDYRDWQIPLGRRFRALKLWFTLRCEGLDSIQTMLRNHVDWAQELAGRMEHDERFELVAPVDLNLVVFALRAGPEATTALVEAINSSGAAQLTRTVLDGRPAVRVSIGGRATQYRHVLALWELLGELAG
jgi:aromatic-L-amino-acid decarboxylase